MDIVLLGNKKAGKSSIQKVVFQKMSPNETWFIENTPKVESLQVQNNPYTKLTIRDFPGTFEVNMMNAQERKYLTNAAVVIYIIDAQDEPYQRVVEKMMTTMQACQGLNPTVIFEVFIHKIDGDMFAHEETKTEILNIITEMVRPYVNEKGVAEPSFHLTSIYDHSIYEALSKVIQKITPQVAYLQNMLDILMSHCRLDKVYVFDVISKLYIATDSTPVDMLSYELCSDMIDVVIDEISRIPSDANYSKAFDSRSTSVIKLDNGLTLYLREIEHLLALVCLVKDDNFERQQLIDYNIDCFKNGTKRIFEARDEFMREEESKTRS